ncbi:unnamed protein product [Spirodela intermedia]|uniref:Uncharacterized protein n=1 Tax=Spirodela intermedia TaxID=51605 RepID=A0A7I8IZK9_SPIIN|nr:unnamed protein product [Spirodela intermedia]CAA6663023.1 unnamed protein product [Spirodela intermedia]
MRRGSRPSSSKLSLSSSPPPTFSATPSDTSPMSDQQKNEDAHYKRRRDTTAAPFSKLKVILEQLGLRGEEEDRSLDLLVRFLHNVFRNISRRVRKAVRSVGFSVDGMLVLAFLWILKAFLEVVCTLGSMVFISILLVRGVWSGVSYFQETRSDQRSRFNNDDDRAWSGVQAAT